MINVSKWLESGAIFKLSPNQYVLSYELESKLSSPKSDFSYFAPDFYLQDDNPWYIFKFNQYLTLNELSTLLENYLKTHSLALEKTRNNLTQWQEPDFNAFKKTFLSIKELIDRGVVNKMVPVIFAKQEIKFSKILKAYCLNTILANEGEQNTYGLWAGDSGILGLTPETLLEVNEHSITTMALAGTGLSQDLKGSLLENPKEMHEHSLVVQNLQQKLGKHFDVNTQDTFEWELNPLKHLRTDITVQSPIATQSYETSLSLIKDLHPTPALGVHAESYDWQQLKKFDPCDRKQFGAPFALYTKNQLKCLVAIRNIQWSDNQILLGSGCGVVAQSELNNEWKELARKRDSVKKYLGL